MRRLACIVACAAIAACNACGSSSSSSSSGSSGSSGTTDGGEPTGDGGSSSGDAGSDEPVLVHAFFDLPSATPTQTLSSAYWHDASKTLFVLPDRQPRIVPLTPSVDFKTWSVAAPIALTGRTSTTWDGEGLTRVGDVFFAVTDETAPTVERFDLTGKRLDEVTIPARFASQQAGNKGLESMTSSPSGAFLFIANESALTTDGARATKSQGTKVRILRRDLAGGGDEERAYRTEPLGPGSASGDMGVSELAALNDTSLLVLERGYQSDYGNTVRIYRVDFTSAARVDGIANLEDSTPTVAKTLVVDLATLPPSGATHPSTQPTPLLDNYESMALGPSTSDGRRLLFLVSDDNQQASQVSRVLVLSVRGL